MRKEPISPEKLYNGMNVKYSIPENGMAHDKEWCSKLLVLNQIYKVDHFDIDKYSTAIYLEGILNIPKTGLMPFNSVMFQEA
jgi:hypothetical protein